MYAGGSFSSANGVQRLKLAAFSATTGALLSWAPSADAGVNAMVMTPDQSKLIVGGQFTTLNGTSAYGMGRSTRQAAPRCLGLLMQRFRMVGATLPSTRCRPMAPTFTALATYSAPGETSKVLSRPTLPPATSSGSKTATATRTPPTRRAASCTAGIPTSATTSRADFRRRRLGPSTAPLHSAQP